MSKIIIIHGLYMHGLVMQPMARRFRSMGYTTECLSYNTVSINEAELFGRIDAALEQDNINYLVGHSLGGVMIRRYLESRRPDTALIPKVAIVGSPINGARIVERVREMNLAKMLGNAPQHGLTPSAGSWELSQELLSVAGNLNVGVGTILLPSDIDSDGTVLLEETKIEGMSSHRVLRCNHTALIYSAETTREINEFFQQSKE